MPWAIAGAVVGAAGTAYAANKSSSASNKAVDAQSASAEQQQQLAQDQWDFQKNVYLPKAMQNADEQLAMSKQLTGQQIKNSDYQMGLSKEQNEQAKKSYEFQDQYAQMARDYASGNVGNVEAGRANADVEQAYTDAAGSLSRAQGRMGINPGSGASAAALADMYTNKALAGAGAQTKARIDARNKAETMVAVAAGSGAAGFGTGAASGALANGSINNAAGTNNTSGNGLNAVSSTYGAGLNGANNSFSGANNSWNSSVNNANNSAGAIAGAANGIGKAIGAYDWGKTTGTGLPGNVSPGGDGGYSDYYTG